MPETENVLVTLKASDTASGDLRLAEVQIAALAAAERLGGMALRDTERFVRAVGRAVVRTLK